VSTAPILYLASKSPRRAELLRQLGVNYRVLRLREAAGRDRDVAEQLVDDEPAPHYVERMARTKAQVAFQRMQSRGLMTLPVLAADTEVVVDGVALGKPADAADAVRMLNLLSGRTHEVISGVALRRGDDILYANSISRVSFALIDAEDIERYVASGEPLDKAGAYAIQGRAAAFVTRLEGSYSGVVGLPLHETASLLASIGLRVL